jgi:hypothetical protein
LGNVAKPTTIVFVALLFGSSNCLFFIVISCFLLFFVIFGYSCHLWWMMGV